MQIPSKELNNLLSKANNILITGQRDPSTDVLSSAAAWQIFLRGQGKQVDVAFAGRNRLWNFLPTNFSLVDLNQASKFKIILDISNTKVRQLSYDLNDNELQINILPEDGNFDSKDVRTEMGDLVYDLVLVLGATSLNSLASIFSEHRQFFHQTPIINIDRSILNENFGQLNIVELKSSSVAEISYHFMKDDMGSELATCLLAGIIAATNSFQSSLVTPELLEIASQLIVKGAERHKIIESLYRTKDIATLKNWGKILSRLKQKGALILSYLEHAEVDNFPHDFQELVRDLLLATPGTQIAAIFYQVDLNKTEVWVHTVDNINVLDLLRDLQPQGRKNLAQIFIDSELNKARDLLTNKIIESLTLINKS